MGFELVKEAERNNRKTAGEDAPKYEQETTGWVTKDHYETIYKQTVNPPTQPDTHELWIDLRAKSTMNPNLKGGIGPVRDELKEFLSKQSGGKPMNIWVELQRSAWNVVSHNTRFAARVIFETEKQREDACKKIPLLNHSKRLHLSIWGE